MAKRCTARVARAAAEGVTRHPLRAPGARTPRARASGAPGESRHRAVGAAPRHPSLEGAAVSVFGVRPRRARVAPPCHLFLLSGLVPRGAERCNRGGDHGGGPPRACAPRDPCSACWLCHVVKG